MSFSGTKGYLTKPKPGVMLNPLHPLSRGLVGYWLFNEGSGSLANDISGCGNHGTLKNMPPNAQGSGWSGSKFGGGLGFGGVNDYIEIDDDPTLNDSYEITLNAMIYPTGWGQNNYGRIFSKDGTELDTSYELMLWNPASEKTIQFQIYGVSASVNLVAPNNSISLYNWYHITAIHKNGEQHLYINGLEVDSDTVTTGKLKDSTKNLNIGRRGTDNLRFFDGIIVHASIYNQAKSTAEVKQLYFDPFCNLLQVPIRRYSVAPPVGVIMNQFQRTNIGADLYNGVFA